MKPGAAFTAPAMCQRSKPVATPIISFPATRFNLDGFPFVLSEPETPLALLTIREEPKYRRQDSDGNEYYMKDGKRVYSQGGGK